MPYSLPMSKTAPADKASKKVQTINIDKPVHEAIKRACPKGYKLRAFAQELLIAGLTAYRQNLRAQGRKP